MKKVPVQYKIVLGFWMLIALFYGFQYYLNTTSKGHNCSFIASFLEPMPNIVVWAIFSLVILSLIKKHPVHSISTRGKRWKVIIPVTVLAIILHLLIVPGFFWLIYGLQQNLPLERYLGSYSTNWVIYQIIVYSIIVSGALAYDFFEKYRKEKSQVLHLEKLLAQTRLQALKMQLQPHFLFNTLNTISMLVRKKEEEKAIRVIVMLADLLRYVLENREIHWVQLKNEISFIEKYLAIEKVRFQDRLEYRIEAGKDTVQRTIPDFLLQPIIENSIKHGISAMPEGGVVQIKTWLEDEMLLIRIMDSGAGFNQDQHPSIPGGLGLKNVRERLFQIYENRAEMKISSEVAGGTTVLLSIPLNHSNIYEPVNIQKDQDPGS